MESTSTGTAQAATSAAYGIWAYFVPGGYFRVEAAACGQRRGLWPRCAPVSPRSRRIGPTRNAFIWCA